MSGTPKGMPALSVRQPFAEALVAGIKTHENRTWVAREVGELDLAHKPDLWWCAIQAGKQLWGNTVPEREREFAHLRETVWPGMGSPALLPRGKVVGLVAFSKAVHYATASQQWKEAHPWATGPFCWEVAHAIKLNDPIDCRGGQGIFRLDADIAAHLRGAYRSWKEAQDATLS